MKLFWQHFLIISFLIIACLSLRFVYEYGSIEASDRSFYEDDKGFLYLQDYDSYFYLNEVQNDHTDDWFSAFLIGWNKVLSVIMPQISVMGSLGYQSLLFIGLSMILLYLGIFQLSGKTWVGLYGSFLFAISPFIYKGTFIGFVDTNIINIFFTLLIIFTYFQTLTKKSLIWVVAFILTISAFSFFWTGWWYLPTIILISTSFYNLLNKIIIPIYKKEFSIKTHWKHILNLQIILSIAIIFIAKHGRKYIHYIINNDQGLNSIMELHNYFFWPFIVSSLPYFYFIITFFALFLFIKKHDDKRIFFLFTLFSLTSIITITGIRFAFFALIPYYFFSAISLKYINDQFFHFKEKHIYLILITIFIFILSLNIMKENYKIVGNPKISIMNDDIYESLHHIPKNKEIIVFWDKFHIIQSITNKTPAGMTTDLTSGGNEMLITALTSENKSYSVNTFQKITSGKPGTLIIFPHDSDMLWSWQRQGMINYSNGSFIEKYINKNVKKVTYYEFEARD